MTFGESALTPISCLDRNESSVSELFIYSDLEAFFCLRNAGLREMQEEFRE